MLKLFALLAVASCNLSDAGTTPPANQSVKTVIAALNGGNSRVAYDLLHPRVRSKLPFEQFEKQWKRSEKERQQLAVDLTAAMQSNVAERAEFAFTDGRTIELVREAGAWRVQAPLVGKTHAGSPRDAAKQFSAALKKRDVESVLALLSESRSHALAAQLQSLTQSLARELADGAAPELLYDDRAEFNWEDRAAGLIFKLMLVREQGQWRIEDLHIRPSAPPSK